MLLQIEHVSKYFGGIIAVNDCHFSVSENKITCLIGPNGAGKTTIFNLITGFLQPTSGRIRFKGKDITNLAPQHIVALGIARSFQNLRLFNQMTVVENVMLAKQDQIGEKLFNTLFYWETVQQADRKTYEEAMEYIRYVGLEQKSLEIVENLSYAEQKLLTIARLLMTEAPLLLLDEPTSGLDHDSLERVLPVIEGLTKAGKTILLIEHNMDIIKDLGDQVIFLNQGHVLGVGTPEAIMSNQELTDIYFGGGVH